jgi:hypothetical protein
MTINRGYVWYYLCRDFDQKHLTLVPFFLFEIIDPRISRHWVFAPLWLDDLEKPDNFFYHWGFPELVNERYFYYNLIEWEKKEEEIFASYKEKMDLEFPDSSVTEVAGIGDKEWLMCPHCIDAWFSPSDRDALVKCPNCNTIMNNPRYSDK